MPAQSGEPIKWGGIFDLKPKGEEWARQRGKETERFGRGFGWPFCGGLGSGWEEEGGRRDGGGGGSRQEGEGGERGSERGEGGGSGGEYTRERRVERGRSN